MNECPKCGYDPRVSGDEMEIQFLLLWTFGLYFFGSAMTYLFKIESRWPMGLFTVLGMAAGVVHGLISMKRKQAETKRLEEIVMDKLADEERRRETP